MKKTVNVSIGKLPFVLDEDAYEALQRYLHQLHTCLAQTPGRDEIVADIEARFAELFTASLGSAYQVVGIDIVNKAIAMMGFPEDIGQSAQAEDSSAVGTPAVIRKRLYRNPEERMVGGVCAGIAAYFHIDPIWLRLLFVGSLFFAGTGLLIYLILWIIIPEAKTPSERLQMRGEPITAQSIRKSVEEELEKFKKSPAPFGSPKEEQKTIQTWFDQALGFVRDLFDGLWRFLRNVLVAVVVLIGVTVSIAIAVVFAGIVSNSSTVFFTSIIDQVIEPVYLWLAGIGLLIIIGIPFILLALYGIKVLFRVQTNTKQFRSVLLALWFIGVLATAGSVAAVLAQFRHQLSITKVHDIPPLYDTLYLTSRQIEDDFSSFATAIEINEQLRYVFVGDTLLISTASLQIQPSHEHQSYLTMHHRFWGSDHKELSRLVASTHYPFEQRDSLLVLPGYFFNTHQGSFHFQQLKLTLHMPESKYVHFDGSLASLLQNATDWLPHCSCSGFPRLYQMAQEGLQCAHCEKK